MSLIAGGGAIPQTGDVAAEAERTGERADQKTAIFACFWVFLAIAVCVQWPQEPGVLQRWLCSRGGERAANAAFAML